MEATTIAVAEDNAVAVLRQLQYGIRLDRWKGDDGACILHQPAHNGKLAIAYILSQWFPQLVVRENDVKQTPFLAAINEDHLDLGDVLLQHYCRQHADVDAFRHCLLHADQYGKTLMHYAAANASEPNAEKSIAYLLSRAYTLTRGSGSHGREDLLRALDGHGCTALQYAAGHGNPATLVCLLVSAGIVHVVP